MLNTLTSKEGFFDKQVAILLSTYNGSHFIREQLDSLLAQSYQNFQLYIRDDGSTDDTLDIIKLYSERDKRITILDSFGNLGVISSFLTLCKAVEADFYFFCDQDDVWFDRKIEETLSMFYGKNSEIPLLAHTDLVVTDSKLNILNHSFYSYTGVYNSSRFNRNNILLRNYVVGCSMAINKNLRNELILCDDGANKMYMHDWMAALIATYLGEVLTYPQPMIYYRQHGNNQCGANKRNSLMIFVRMFNIKHLSKLISNRNKIYSQIEFFNEQFGIRLDSTSSDLINHIIIFKHSSFLERIFKLVNRKLPTSTPFRKLFDLFFINKN